MEPQRPIVERITNRLRANPIVATLIVVGFVVVWLATFTEAIKKLRTLWPTEAPAMVAGRWESEALKDVRTTLEFRYVFDLKADGAKVYGTAHRTIPYCEQKNQSGLCAGYGRQVAILDGTLDKKALSFACDWGELPGAAPWTWVKLQETFRGSVDGATIRFVQQDDQNNPPVEFTAKLPAGGAGARP